MYGIFFLLEDGYTCIKIWIVNPGILEDDFPKPSLSNKVYLLQKHACKHTYTTSNSIATSQWKLNRIWTKGTHLWFPFLFCYSPGIMPKRDVPQTTLDDWLQLARIFDTLHGGSEVSQRASLYLRGLASNTLPMGELLPLPWHADHDIEVMPQAREEPHACVLAVLSPSIPLRAVWKRGR